MRIPGWAAAVFAGALLASCAPRTAPPAPAPAPPPPPPPVATPPPPPPAPGWPDAPLSPGDWSYRQDGAGPTAAFGTDFALRCDSDRRISLIRAAAAGTALTVRTSSGQRALPGAPGPAGLVARLGAADPLLDAIAFSRGRFAIEAEGVPQLILPAWPEPARVIEDCRG